MKPNKQSPYGIALLSELVEQARIKLRETRTPDPHCAVCESLSDEFGLWERSGNRVRLSDGVRYLVSGVMREDWYNEQQNGTKWNPAWDKDSDEPEPEPEPEPFQPE